MRHLTHGQAPWQGTFIEGSRRRRIPDQEMTDYFRNEVPASDRNLHPNVVVITADVLEDDDEADKRLRAFLTG